ncbi:MAG: hypothetical protein KatS3mg014_1037 [Actinomycetota bacterium]|nr:MAG: hypothetical protein KatS3mg014_1037 [Actinomycetota bacterium]
MQSRVLATDMIAVLRNATARVGSFAYCSSVNAGS